MINASNEFKQQIASDNRNYLEYADITLTDGTLLHLTNEHIWQGGLSIEDAVSSDESFDIGAAIINKCTLTLNNIYDDFSDYVFEGAEVITYIGLELPDGTIEKLRKGTFAVDETKYNGSIITLGCLDNMRKFDRPYSESTLNYPATIGEILLDACLVCGVTLLETVFTNSDYTIKTKPDKDGVTFREIVSWVAQIACKFAKMDTYGRLELKWYDETEITAPKYLLDTNRNEILTKDGENIVVNAPARKEDYISGNINNNIHRIVSKYSQSVGLDDVVITGIKVSSDLGDEGKTYLYGTNGYVLSIDGNGLINEENGQEIADVIGSQAVGLRFRPSTFSVSSDPTMEAGDRAYVIDSKENVYIIYLTNVAFSTGSAQAIKCSAKTPERNSATRYSAQTKTIVEARRNAKKQISEYDKAVQLLTSLITQSFGVFKTEEVSPDGSVIYYMHNKPKLEESQTIWKMTADAFAVSTDGRKTWNAGMDSSGNAVLNVLSAIGINADWINVGEMLADRIRGGTLILGGSEGQDGSIQILSSEGREIGYIDKTGAYFLEGDFAGRLSAISGLIGGWTIDNTCIYSDFTVSPTEIYRVYLQTYLRNYGKDTWVLSVQKYDPETDKFYGMMFIRGDGKISTSGIIGNLPVEGYVHASGNTHSTFMGGITCGDDSFYPGKVLSVIGSESVRDDLNVYGTFYAASGSIDSSDRRIKNSIKKLDHEQSANFIYSLEPVQYKYNDGTSGRYHHGFIAQDVKASMGDGDWGLYCEIKKENPCKNDQEPKEETICSLRYTELIADLVATIQLQNKEINDIKKEIMMLKEELKTRKE